MSAISALSSAYLERTPPPPKEQIDPEVKKQVDTVLGPPSIQDAMDRWEYFLNPKGGYAEYSHGVDSGWPLGIGDKTGAIDKPEEAKKIFDLLSKLTGVDVNAGNYKQIMGDSSKWKTNPHDPAPNTIKAEQARAVHQAAVEDHGWKSGDVQVGVVKDLERNGCTFFRASNKAQLDSQPAEYVILPSGQVKRMPLMMLLVSAASTVAASTDPVPVCSYKVVRSYPHDARAFTQGLLFKDGILYESTGLRGQSSIRKVRLENGEVLQKTELADSLFGEGLAAWQDSLIQITWTSGVGFVLGATDLKVRRTFRYQGDGWGLAQSDRALLMSDGTAQIRVLDPVELKELSRINVTAGGAPVLQLNELEWVDGELYANIWRSDRIARIDPKNGHVKSWIDLAGLLKGFGAGERGEAVLNGIAYDNERGRLFVTGKLWPKLFEIKLTGPGVCQTGSKTAALGQN